jgi:hypothetical protein
MEQEVSQLELDLSPRCYVCGRPAVRTPKDGLTLDYIGEAHNLCLNALSTKAREARVRRLQVLERARRAEVA